MFNIVYIYYDDVLDCGSYASDVIEFPTYRKAVKAFYESVRNYNDEPVNVSADFKIKALDRFLHGDLSFTIKNQQGHIAFYTYNIFKAVLRVNKENLKLIGMMIRIAYKSHAGLFQTFKFISGIKSFYQLKITEKW